MKRDASLIRLSRDHQRGLALAKRIDDVLAAVDAVPLTQLEQETVDIWEDGLAPHFPCRMRMRPRPPRPSVRRRVRPHRTHPA